MVTHVVSFKLKSDTPESKNAVREKLMSMRDKVPQLRHLEVGIDSLRTARSYDIILITRFDNWADADAYQVEPYHQEVLAYMRDVASAVVAVDYEAV